MCPLLGAGFWTEIWTAGVIPIPLALAAVAAIGYVIGRQRRQQATVEDIQARRELKRAQAVARQLETIADSVRKNLSTHHSSIARFKDRVTELGNHGQDTAWKDLCREAEEMLKPTLRLATELAHAYDEIRQQSNHLMTFTEVRTDPLTGVSNRRALDETLASMFSMLERYELPFSLVMVDIDHFKKINDEKGHLYGDMMLKNVAQLLDEAVRDTDTVARYGGEEFVIVMPNTDLAGACLFSERLGRNVEESLKLTISSGTAMASDGDDAQSLLSRADSALYSAKAAGRNRGHHHAGTHIQPNVEETNREEEQATVPMSQAITA